MTKLTQGFSDVFDKWIADGTKTKIDMPSHDKFSAERYRLFKNGNREFVQYGSPDVYNFRGDRHVLSPSAGDTVVLETAERINYNVQFELGYSMAIKLDQSLNTGDHIRVGAFDGDNGWYLEHNGSHSDTECSLVILREGSKKEENGPISLNVPFTRFTRLFLRSAWYDTARQLWKRSYPNSDGKQENPEIGRTALPNDDGPLIGNLPIRYEIHADGGTTGLKAICGSSAAAVYGDVNEQTRAKIVADSVSTDGSGDWVPLLAMRLEPSMSHAKVRIPEFQVMKFPGAADVFLLLQSHDSSKVLDANGDPLTSANYSVPEGNSEQDSLIRQSKDVDQAPDNTGTPVTSASDPGGFQIGRASLYTSGQGTTRSERSSEREQKHPLYGNDVAVLWAKSTATDTVSFEMLTEQYW